MKRLFALLCASLVLLTSCGQPYTFRGTEIMPAKAAPDFTLTDQNGQPFTLSEQRGNVVLVFFGFTHCPDVCPTTMADIAAAREQLGDTAEKVEVAFITVDPERDTTERLGGYLKNYDPTFIGLTGSQADLDAIYKNYGVVATRRDLPDSQIGYTMDHSAFVYMIDRDGNWRGILPFGVSADDIASDAGYLARN